MKRPWTPDHKTPDGTVVFSEKTYPAWKKLCDKAPEMAELLIKLVECDSEPLPLKGEAMMDVLVEAKKLLKEVGYDSRR